MEIAYGMRYRLSAAKLEQSEGDMNCSGKSKMILNLMFH